MGINVRYEAPASAIYGAAAGYGRRQLRKEQDQLRLAYDKMALDDLQQQRGIAANAYAQAASQAFNAQQSAMDRRFRWGLTNQQAQLERGQRVKDRNFAADLTLSRDEAARKEQAERDNMQAENAAFHDQRMNDAAMQRQNSMMEKQFIHDAELSLRANEDDYRNWITNHSRNWAGGKVAKQRLAELNSTIDATKADGNLSEKNKQTRLQELYGKRWDLIQNPPPLEPDEVPKTPGQELDESTEWRTDPDGVQRRYQKIMINGFPQWDVVAERSGKDAGGNGLTPQDQEDLKEILKEKVKIGAGTPTEREEPLGEEDALKELQRRRNIRARAAGAAVETGPAKGQPAAPSQGPADITISPDNPAFEGPTRRVSGGAYGKGAEIDAKGRRVNRPTPPPPPPMRMPDGTLQEVQGGLPVIDQTPEGEQRIMHLLELSPVVQYIDAKTGKYMTITRP